jgi:hypothetical protein
MRNPGCRGITNDGYGCAHPGKLHCTACTPPVLARLTTTPSFFAMRA